MKAVIYTRYSSESQRETSLEDQERLCREEAARLGYTVAKVYKDAALSGQLWEDRRPGFQAMLAAAKRKEFDALIVDDLSRLSRDTADALNTIKKLRFWSVGLVARTDGVNTLQNEKGSRTLYFFKAFANEEFLRDLAERTWRGQQGRVLKGLSPGGLPYGYRSEPVRDAQGDISGYRRVIYKPEAEVVRRIFQLYVGDVGGKPHSARGIAVQLNEEGVAPPGARWRNKSKRQAKTWSYTAIIGHRRRLNGILNNPIYNGKLVWNRTAWAHDPDTKQYGYRVRPRSEWVEVDAPDLRIIPQDLWIRVQARLALQSVPMAGRNRHNIGKYLLSGFIKCGECGGAYIKTNHSYRCGNHRNRGNRACTNTRGVTVERLQRTVIAALRERLYTPANLRAIIERVRDELLRRAKQEEKARAVRPPQQAKAIRALEAEVENIKKAVTIGKATPILLGMLEERDAHLQTLRAGREPPARDNLHRRVQQILADLPERVQQYLENLETLLAKGQVARGKDILAALGTEIVIRPNGTAEICGDLRKALTLAGGGRNESVLRWLGEEDSNPR